VLNLDYDLYQLGEVYQNQLEKEFEAALTNDQTAKPSAPQRLAEFSESFEFRLSSEQLKLFQEKYRIQPKKSDEELSLFIQLAAIMSEVSGHLCSALRGANMDFGDVGNINRKVTTGDIQTWVMLMQVWGRSVDMQPHYGLKRSRLLAHQALASALDYLKSSKATIRKLLLSAGIKCEIEIDPLGKQSEKHKLLQSLSEIEDIISILYEEYPKLFNIIGCKPVPNEEDVTG